MKIWVDGDACPVVIKEILYKAAVRTGVVLTLVANRQVRIPPSSLVKFIKVESGQDVADREIIRRMDGDDLVITADIPLAAEVIEKGGTALSPRGELFSDENIKDRLSVRDFMDSLRASGIDTGGPSAFSRNDRHYFANQLDKYLTRHAENC